MKTLLALPLVAVALLVTVPADAAGGRHMQRMLERIDTDGDGTISRDEAQAAHDARFARMDINGDGAVTREEIRQARENRRAERHAKRFERLDLNGDGAIERSEFDEARNRRFARIDANGDGRITPDEMRAIRRGGIQGE